METAKAVLSARLLLTVSRVEADTGFVKHLFSSLPDDVTAIVEHDLS